MISLENIYYKYPKADTEIIQNITQIFREGECVAISGRNGCGKTTLINLVCGIIRPTSGRIIVDGIDIRQHSLFDIGQKIGCVFQDPSRQLFCTSVEKEIRFGLESMCLPETEIEARLNKYISFFHLEHRKNAFPLSLSQGERQRVVLAAVLAMGTEHIILDEPTSGLDMRGRSELGMLLKVLTDSGRCVVFVSHERAFIEKYADREWVLK